MHDLQEKYISGSHPVEVTEVQMPLGRGRPVSRSSRLAIRAPESASDAKLKPDSEDPGMSAEQLEKLRSLGYIQ